MWKVLKICSSLFVTCDYGVKEKRFWKDKDLRRFTPLHNPSNGVQHFVWRCQNKGLYEESSLYQFGWFHHWFFFVDRHAFPTKNRLFFKWKIREKNAESSWNIFTFVTFLIMSSVMPLEQRLPKRGDAYYWEFPSPRPSITLRKAPAKVYFVFYSPVILRKRKKKKRGNEFQKTKQLLHFKK